MILHPWSPGRLNTWPASLFLSDNMSLMIEALPESGSPDQCRVTRHVTFEGFCRSRFFLGGLKAIWSLLVVVGVLVTVVIAILCYICDSFLYARSFFFWMTPPCNLAGFLTICCWIGDFKLQICFQSFMLIRCNNSDDGTLIAVETKLTLLMAC